MLAAAPLSSCNPVLAVKGEEEVVTYIQWL